jgi:hypothetical protein
MFIFDCCCDLLVDEDKAAPSAEPLNTRPLQQPASRKRGCTNICEYVDADCQHYRLTPITSNWYLLYILKPAATSKANFSIEIPSPLSFTLRTVP